MIVIDWGTSEIQVPQSYLTLISGTLYQMDTEVFRTDLRALEASFAGMSYLVTHKHETETTVVGTLFARKIIIKNNYNVTFEDGQYSVILVGSNNNIWDIEGGILNQNQVQVIPTNSAGLVKAITAKDVWEHEQASSVTVLNSRNANP